MGGRARRCRRGADRRRPRRSRARPPPTRAAARPGHHVTRTSFGGSCYLNNTAVAAAQCLRGARAARWRCVDVDAHHGNGTQAIFYDDPDVLVGSVHVDPGAGWFPHFLGFASETGAGGANRNLPLAPGAGDAHWLAAVARARAVGRGGASALVVALGVDAAGGDPESPLRGDGAPAFAPRAARWARCGLPTVVVQEGGYDLDTIGALVHEFLTGLEEGLDG